MKTNDSLTAVGANGGLFVFGIHATRTLQSLLDGLDPACTVQTEQCIATTCASWSVTSR